MKGGCPLQLTLIDGYSSVRRIETPPLTVKQLESIPSDQQNLFFAGKQLEWRIAAPLPTTSLQHPKGVHLIWCSSSVVVSKPSVIEAADVPESSGLCMKGIVFEVSVSFVSRLYLVSSIGLSLCLPETVVVVQQFDISMIK